MFESNLLTQINVHTQLPTFVETHIVSTLNQSLHDAFRFAHAMLGDRYETVGALLPYSSEIFYTLWGALEWSMLKHLDSTFAEYLFGLKRCLLVAADVGSSTAGASSSSLRVTTQPLTFQPLTQRARVLTWLSLVVFPYTQRWLRQRYDKLTAGTPDAELERQSLERRYGRVMALLHRALLLLYPALHLLTEGSTYVFLFAFLLERTPYQSLWQKLNRIVVKRITISDQRAAQATPGATRVLFLSQLVLVVTMLGFRFLEWRPANGNGTNSSSADTPDDNRPVSRPSVEEAASAAVEAGVCPVCKRSITNPAVNSASGVVGCYPCLQTFVTENGRCPATQKICITQNIRRLYEM